jgi:hypothetical protein
VAQNPFRVIGAALALAGAVTAIVFLALPGAAIGSRPSGENQVWYYTNAKGAKIGKVGEDEDFNIIGKNLFHTVQVFCFAGDAADDPDGHGPWDTLTNWNYGPTNKSLIDGDMDPDCAAQRSAIQVQFDNGTPGDESDDIFVTGPGITVGPDQG